LFFFLNNTSGVSGGRETVLGPFKGSYQAPNDAYLMLSLSSKTCFFFVWESKIKVFEKIKEFSKTFIF